MTERTLFGEKRILDVSSSRKLWWPLGLGLHVAIDIDGKTRPDAVADARRLPFADNTFDEVWGDPPHVVRPERHSGESRVRYGEFGRYASHEEAADFLAAILADGLRVAKPGGFFRMKVTTGEDRVLSWQDIPRGYSIIWTRKSRVTWSGCEVSLLEWIKASGEREASQ